MAQIVVRGKRTALRIIPGMIGSVDVQRVVIPYRRRLPRGERIIAEPPISESADLRNRYPRHPVDGNPSMETLVMHNYGRLILATAAIIRRELAKGTFTSERNTVNDVRVMCQEPEGFCAWLFTLTDGTPMKRNRAFGYMVNQFFRDIDMSRKLFTDVRDGHFKG
ncbi:hypothetical protein COT30_01255 [Candidatus Micrarchaeota archaeon CG08_land_8_20_14_0_20_49_17]|nr:MAG: hypothetical protein AUJ13_00655 [Candidatus Micrarchaeota archaeon CG1_02_49_24]PIU10057.1 MAG: hypothetical protein COT30_01255 [Candidatus Micrarchaeota archaeon CG08_land_8_20_14_0_20_49_17]PIZ97146.1 MAG: hypothetical protein COX84_03335 [Candidatus Micrarchaeota archaeon CG_4_10_14_0_2_um_filter_49_7]HII54375.1 hypothetical protein [Candidatus Micrarchaeota archaeon]